MVSELKREDPHSRYVHSRPVTIPSGQLVSPVTSSFGNAAMPMAKKEDMKDRGKKRIVTTVNTSTVCTVCKLGRRHLDEDLLHFLAY
jgi:predicted solute-binding protein